MPHTKAQKFKPEPRLKPTLKYWWQARKADVLTITSHVAPNVLATCKMRLRDGFAQTVVHAATLRQTLLIKLAVSFSHGDIKPASPSTDPVRCKAPCRLTTGVPIVKSLV